MRKLVVAAAAVAVGASGIVAVPARGAEPDPANVGAYSPLFREDGAPFDPATRTFGGERGDSGCLPGADEQGHRNCLPAGASQNVLADGRILYWNAIEGAEDLKAQVATEGGDAARNDSSRVLTLDRDVSRNRWAVPSPEDAYFEGSGTEPPLIPGTRTDDPGRNDASLFCSDQKQLADGRIIAAGGTNYYAEPRVDSKTGLIELEGARNTRIFDPATNEWRPSGDLNIGRWYPSMVTLPGGGIFIASGVTKLVKPIYPSHPTDSGTNVRQTEVFDPGTGRWTLNPDSANRALPLYPRLHLLPNGKVYYDAAGQSYNPFGQAYDEALWNIAATYDPASKTWANLGIPGIGTATEPGFRGSTFSQMLPLKPPYNSASFLSAGGVLAMSPGSYLPTLTSRINRISIDGKTEKLETFATGMLKRARWYGNGVTLPTGQVLLFSGADLDEVITPGNEQPIREVDGKGGTWTDVAPQTRGRTYHNNAVLLPDGRVLIGGHAPIPNGYGAVKTTDAVKAGDRVVREYANNFKDASFQIYSPPYLFRGPRPQLGTVKQRIDHGEVLPVPVPSGADSVKSVVLVRNPAQTHLIDGDQRAVELEILGRSDGLLRVKVPESNSVLPEGPYMLFVNSDAGEGLVPSESAQVFVGVDVPPHFRRAAPAQQRRPSARPGGGRRASAEPALAPLAPVALEAAPAARVRPERPAKTTAPAIAATAALVAVVGLGIGRRRRRT
jgi:hypothetical protein